MITQDLKDLNSGFLLNELSRFTEEWAINKKHRPELEIYYNELKRRLDFYDKATKAARNVSDLVNKQEDTPAKFEKLFQENMRRILA